MEPLLPPTPLAEPLALTCHCGRVRVAIAAKPAFVNECQCTVCYKLGAMWGYLERRQVDVTAADGATVQSYVRTDAGGDGDCAFNRCSHCGSLVSWRRVPGNPGDETERMGVNLRLLGPGGLEGLERRKGTGPMHKVKKAA
ncbi:hypothetical protein QBC39DRAFT_378423 [Podospora conica]|nr:hypothetical protein QBC39DRAFT_378423 [Schizothecium conicum]